MGAKLIAEMWIHCGLAKTGSSAIQAFLAENKSLLLDKYGILAPGNPKEHYHFQTIFSDDPARLEQVRRNGLHVSSDLSLFCRAFLAEVEREIEVSKPKVIIVSSEYFASMREHELRRMIQFFWQRAQSVRWLAYVRDPWSFSLSLAQEYIRGGRLSNRVVLGYAMSNLEILELFERGLGYRFLVRPTVQIGRNRTDTLRDFIDLMGIDTEDTDLVLPSHSDVNPAIGRAAACFLAHLNAIWPQFDDQGLYLRDGARDWTVNAVIEADVQKQPLRMSRETAERIRNDANSDLERLERRYFCGAKYFTDAYDPNSFECDYDDTISISQVPHAELVSILITAMTSVSRAGLHFYELHRLHDLSR